MEGFYRSAAPEAGRLMLLFTLGGGYTSSHWAARSESSGNESPHPGGIVRFYGSTSVASLLPAHVLSQLRNERSEEGIQQTEISLALLRELIRRNGFHPDTEPPD